MNTNRPQQKRRPSPTKSTHKHAACALHFLSLPRSRAVASSFSRSFFFCAPSWSRCFSFSISCAAFFLLPIACASFSMFLLLFMLLVCASLVGRPSRLPRHRLLSVCFLRCSVARCTHIITVSVKQTTNIHKSTNLLRDQRHTHNTHHTHQTQAHASIHTLIDPQHALIATITAQPHM